MAEAVPQEHRGPGRPHTINRDPSPATVDAEEITTFSGKRIKVTDREFALMLEKAGGFKSRVAKQLGISVSAVCHRIQRSEYLREACKTIEETVLDLAEGALLKAANRGEAWAVTFILKCKGRKRGWIERQDVVFGGEMDAPPPPFVIELHDPAYVEAERKRIEEETARSVEAMTIDVPSTTVAATGPTAPNSPSGGETSGASGPSLAPGTGNVAQDRGVGADVGGQIPPDTGSGAAQGAPRPQGAPTPAPRPKAPTGPQTPHPAQPQPPPPQEPRRPRTPSEAAAMRREREERERAAGNHAQAATPSFAVPVAFPRR